MERSRRTGARAVSLEPDCSSRAYRYDLPVGRPCVPRAWTPVQVESDVWAVYTDRIVSRDKIHPDKDHFYIFLSENAANRFVEGHNGEGSPLSPEKAEELIVYNYIGNWHEEGWKLEFRTRDDAPLKPHVLVPCSPAC